MSNARDHTYQAFRIDRSASVEHLAIDMIAKQDAIHLAEPVLVCHLRIAVTHKQYYGIDD